MKSREREAYLPGSRMKAMACCAGRTTLPPLALLFFLCFLYFLVCFCLSLTLYFPPVFRTPLYSLSACFLSRFSWVSIGEGKPISGMGVLEINLKVPVVFPLCFFFSLSPSLFSLGSAFFLPLAFSCSSPVFLQFFPQFFLFSRSWLFLPALSHLLWLYSQECQASLQLKRLQSHYCRNRSCGRRRRRRC